MSSNIDVLYPISFQKSLISANLNTTLLVLYLSGGYIGFYAFTLWIYVPKTPRSTKRVVITILTALFATALIQLVMAWYFTHVCFVRETKNRLDTFSITLLGIPFVNVLSILTRGIGQILADALLIWRSYHILAQWRYLRLGLICLYIAEVVLLIIWILMAVFLYYVNPSDNTPEFARQFNVMQGTSSCVTVVTSVLATFVIGAQIYASTAMNRQARRRYQYLIEIIIQSSALYSISILLSAITTLVDTNQNITASQSGILDADNYWNVIASFITSFAPTLMVARLELSKDKANTEFSTNMMSEPPGVLSSAFEAAPCQDGAPSIEQSLARARYTSVPALSTIRMLAIQF